MNASLDDPRSDSIERGQVGAIGSEIREKPMLTNRRRAARNAAGMIAIVAAMFMLFYGINTQQTRSVATSPDTAETTGQR